MRLFGNFKGKQLTKKHTIPGFLTKTYEIFSNSEYERVCSWGPSGDTIVIRDTSIFSLKILPKFFKHSNYPSFVRQLNMYDFHKTVQDPTHGEFRHPFFRRDRKDLLYLIRRKVSSKLEAQNLQSTEKAVKIRPSQIPKHQRQQDHSAHKATNKSKSNQNQNQNQKNLKTWKKEVESKLEKVEKYRKISENENNMLRETIRAQCLAQREIQLRHQKVFFLMYEMFMRKGGNDRRYALEPDTLRTNFLANDPANQIQIFPASQYQTFGTINQSQVIVPSIVKESTTQSTSEMSPKDTSGKLILNVRKNNNFAEPTISHQSPDLNQTNLNSKTTVIYPTEIDQYYENKFQVHPNLVSSSQYIENIEPSRNQINFEANFAEPSKIDAQVFDDLPPIEQIHNVPFNCSQIRSFQGNKRTRGFDLDELENSYYYKLPWEINLSEYNLKSSTTIPTKRRKPSQCYDTFDNDFQNFDQLDLNVGDIFDSHQAEILFEGNDIMAQKAGNNQMKENFDHWSFLN